METINTGDVDADFMATPRLGIFMTPGSNAPVGVPVWFEWQDGAVELFSARDAFKVRQVTRGQPVSLLVTNQVGEPERWYRFEGQGEVLEDGGLDLALRLAERYWDTSIPEHQQMLAFWREHADALCRIRLSSPTIRTGS